MAKNIKTIQCPKCGSSEKTEIKPDYYICSACNTEYFLDNDDITINVNHKNLSPSKTGNNNLSWLAIPITIALAIFLTVIFAITAVVRSFFKTNKKPKNQTEVIAVSHYDYGVGNIVYANTVTGEPIYIRLGRENIKSEDLNLDEVNIHLVVIDPVKKKIINDEILFPHIKRLDNNSTQFIVTQDGNIYMKYGELRLFKVDRENNKLIEVTESLFKNHVELSGGLAEMYCYENYFRLLTNDGVKFYYVPENDALVENDDVFKLDEILRSMSNELIFDFYDGRLIKRKSCFWIKEGNIINVTPDRKYFQPKILHQDKSSLIITTALNAAPVPQFLLQSLDVNTGKVIWSRPAAKIDYLSGARCNEGFAVEYRTSSDMDYISGVLVISPSGQLISDYLIKRGE